VKQEPTRSHAGTRRDRRESPLFRRSGSQSWGGLTDRPIGGPVAVDLSRADGQRVDQDLLDPAHCWYVYGQPEPAPQGHSGYWADPRVWTEVNRMAAAGPRIPVGSGTH
jgi:hypothetical protein